MKQQRRTATRQGNGNFEALYQDIERLGGSQHAEVSRGVLRDMEEAILRQVRAAPDAFGADLSDASQQAAAAGIMERLRKNYLEQLAADLRRRAGYVMVLGFPVHRSVLTFLVYTIMAGVSLTVFFTKVLSPQPGDFTQGIIGLGLVIACGLTILVRVRK